MKEKIYTIMINEAIEEDKGCPLCLIKEKLLKNALEYYMGAAMMEPDVRCETNEKGFCSSCAAAMLSMGNRLSLALMLQTHAGQMLCEIDKSSRSIFSKNKTEISCAVCDRVKEQMSACTKNMALLLSESPEFRSKFKNGTGVCMPHFKELSLFTNGEGLRCLKEKTKEVIAAEKKALDGFVKSFDYNGAPPTERESKSPETGVEFLCRGK